MKKSISIVVPIYKVPEKLLRKCIRSLIDQTLKNIEIILVDDESPDNCGKICDEYSKIDNRIIVIHQKNKGLSGARNAGVKAATGEYVMFNDGDDWIELNACELLYNCTKKYKYDVVDACLVKQFGNSLYHFDYSKFEDGKAYFNDDVKFWQVEMLDFNGNVSSANAKIMNREFLIRNNIFHDEKLKYGAEGLEYGIRMYGAARSVFFIKKEIYHYVYNENSITEIFDEKNIELTLDSFKKIKNTIEYSYNRADLINKFYNRLLYAISTAAISGYFSPTNKDNYKVKKEKYSNYLKDVDVKKALKLLVFDDMNLSRKITIYTIKFRLYRIIDLISKIRYKQKHNKSK